MPIKELQEALSQLLVVACAGAAGGFVGGINTATNNSLRLMSVSRTKEYPRVPQIDLGFIGDLVVGAAAGVAIVFFLEAASGDATMSPMHLIPIGLMVGVVSKKALVGMSEAAIRKLFSETEKLRNEHGQLQAEVKKLDHINELIREGENYLKEGEEAGQDDAKRIQKFRSAQATFLEATEYDHGHSKAYVGLGKSLKRLAGETRNPAEERRLLQQAIDAATEAIKLDPNYERAFYNRACYQAVIGAPAEEILQDLKDAIRLYRLNSVWAKSDSDFAALRSDPRFIAVVDGAEDQVSAEQVVHAAP